MQIDPRPVPVSKHAFAFCRYSIMVMLWVAFAFKLKLLVVLAFALLALSAALGVARSPLIVLYGWTIGRAARSTTVDLDINGMRFAHVLGSILTLACVVFLYSRAEDVGWRLTFIVAILKSVSAFGLCPAYKLFGCMTSGTCCAFLRKS